jgi:hypothetical protein
LSFYEQLKVVTSCQRVHLLLEILVSPADP